MRQRYSSAGFVFFFCALLIGLSNQEECYRGIYKTRVSMRNTYKILVQEAERNRPYGRLRSKWENNVKMDLEATGCVLVSRGNELVDWG